MGAINRAAMNIDLNDRVPAYEAMDMLDKVIGGPIHVFNDRPSTTHGDVLRALDLAIRMGQT
jgi:hypothetical protein